MEKLSVSVQTACTNHLTFFCSYYVQYLDSYESVDVLLQRYAKYNRKWYSGALMGGLIGMPQPGTMNLFYLTLENFGCYTHARF